MEQGVHSCRLSEVSSRHLCCSKSKCTSILLPEDAITRWQVPFSVPPAGRPLLQRRYGLLSIRVSSTVACSPLRNSFGLHGAPSILLPGCHLYPWRQDSVRTRSLGESSSDQDQGGCPSKLCKHSKLVYICIFPFSPLFLQRAPRSLAALNHVKLGAVITKASVTESTVEFFIPAAMVRNTRLNVNAPI
eukprot:scaffold136469_cov17-Tisochrysis_lutea.AAC.1